MLERVDLLLTERGPSVRDLQTAQALLWETPVGINWMNVGISRLPSVLEMVLSGKRCSRELLDKYAEEGLFMQSAEDNKFPEVHFLL